MRACYQIDIETPKKVSLFGLWFGPKKAKRVIVWVLGLGSNMLSKTYIFDELVDKETAVLTFNNRGHDKVAVVSTSGKKRIKGGCVHEVFTDSVDDIQGAINYAKRSGAKDIILVGHSTGCQKSAYWARMKGKGVKGVVLLAPISDYASEKKAQGAAALKRAEKVARAYMRAGKKHEALPDKVWSWPWTADAQRFLSLYTGEGPEEIFTYWDFKKTPTALRSVKLPMLVLLAESDEYSDRPARDLYKWFMEHIYEGEVRIVKGVKHSFKGAEREVAALIRNWSRENS